MPGLNEAQSIIERAIFLKNLRIEMSWRTIRCVEYMNNRESELLKK